MALLELLLARLTEPISWVALVLGLLTAYALHFWHRVRSLPPGPTALPFIGNILQLRSGRPLHEKAAEWCRKYGDPITVWVGTNPFVIASSKESFKDISGPLRNLVGGRPQSQLGAVQARGFEDVVFSDFTPAWDTLRRLAHVAMRKYAVTTKLAELVADKVDVEVNDVLAGADEKQFEVVEFIEGVINNVLAVSTFGDSFKKGDAKYEKMRQATQEFETHSPNGLPSDILPILGYIFWRQERAARRSLNLFSSITDEMFAQAKGSWSSGKNRHFTDVLLNAREEFLAEDRGSAKYLTDENLRQVVFDIFGAGTGTSRAILSFCCLRLANDPELQEELRSEVADELGTRVCTLEDRERLKKVDSFLQEMIRFTPPAPLSLPRKANADVTINGRAIPKDTNLMINVYAVNRDKSIWGPDAHSFKPDRFLTVTKDQQNRGANSFGIGARSCPGEKMAQSDMFYSLVRILQKVKLSCVNGPGSAILDKNDSDLFIDAPRQKLIFKRVKA